MPTMTKRQFEEMFREEVLPHVIERYGTRDRPARREAWNDTVDAYIRERVLPEAAGNWTHPSWLETWSPPQRHHAKKKSEEDKAIESWAAAFEAVERIKRDPKLKKKVDQLDRDIAKVLSSDFKVGDAVQLRWEPGTGGVIRRLDPNGAVVATSRGERKVPTSALRRVRREHEPRVRRSVPAHATKRVAKTKLLWIVQGNYGYGQGWEDVTAEENSKEARDRIREYRENERGVPFRLIRRREKIAA
jgi:hypothetical protein